MNYCLLHYSQSIQPINARQAPAFSLRRKKTNRSSNKGVGTCIGTGLSSAAAQTEEFLSHWLFHLALQIDRQSKGTPLFKHFCLIAAHWIPHREERTAAQSTLCGSKRENIHSLTRRDRYAVVEYKIYQQIGL